MPDRFIRLPGKNSPLASSTSPKPYHTFFPPFSLSLWSGSWFLNLISIVQNNKMLMWLKDSLPLKRNPGLVKCVVPVESSMGVSNCKHVQARGEEPTG